MRASVKFHVGGESREGEMWILLVGIAGAYGGYA